MKKMLVCLCGISFAVAGVSGQAADARDLVGEWACYGFEESDTSTYSGEYDITYSEDGGWTSEGQFGEQSNDVAGQPYEWDYSASGRWAVEGETLTSTTGAIRFLPTRGGADYEAADPDDYLRIPITGTWQMDVQDPEFMTLQSEDGRLLFECAKQIDDYE